MDAAMFWFLGLSIAHAIVTAMLGVRYDTPGFWTGTVYGGLVYLAITLARRVPQ